MNTNNKKKGNNTITDKKIKKFSYYPEFSDKNFYEKIYKKKEFNMFKIPVETRQMEEICNPESYELMPQQKFLKNYISPNTPYNAILIYHGTGVGKTCTAIGIAENFKEQMKEYSTKALVIVSSDIESNFRNEIYNIDKELDKKPYERDVLVQCTGEAYKMTEDELKYLTKKQLRRKVRANINNNYKFVAYIKLANDIKRQTNWNGDESLITDKVKQIIKKRYSNRVIIIDEVQNIRDETQQDKMVPPIIEAMIKYSDNVKLILMSATPMYHSPREIIYILNLMLCVDKKPLLNEDDIFDKQDNITPKGRKILIEKSKGYISYLKGENPYTFPIKLIPNEARVLDEVKIDINNKFIPKDERLKEVKIIPCNMSNFQYKGYLDILESSKSSVSHIMMLSNITYKTKSNKHIKPDNSYKDMYSGSDNGKGAFIREVKKLKIRKRKIIKFKYQKHMLYNRGQKDEKPFLDEKYIGDFSTKFAECLKNIKHSKGLVLVFTRFINAGILPFSLMLEQNGFSRYEENDLLDYEKNRKGGGGKSQICYKCSNEPSNEIHRDQSLKGYHRFSQAQYIAITGSELTKYNPETATSIFNRPENMYGKNVKVIVGGESIREGINFMNVRQIHIIDPWHNLSKLEQIIGRSIRNCSHKNLPEELRNVDVFLYAAVQPEKMRIKDKLKYVETDDVRRYRLSEINDDKIKKVEKILKETAVDCVLNKNRNKCIKVEKKLINSFGDTISYSSEMKRPSKSSNASKVPDCDYRCIWEPKKSQEKKMKLDTDTYMLVFRKQFIKESKKYIQYLFKLNNYYTLDIILQKIQELNSNIDDIFIYKALKEMITNEEKITDKFNRQGIIINKDKYFYYQPDEMDYKSSPIYYKGIPLKTKPSSIQVSHYFQKNINKNTTNTQLQSYDEIIEKIRSNGEKLYNKIMKNKITDMVDGLLSLNLTNDESKLKKLLLEYELDRLNAEKELSIVLSTVIKNKITGVSSNSEALQKYILNYYKDSLLYEKGKLVGFRIDEKISYCYNFDSGSWQRCDINRIFDIKNNNSNSNSTKNAKIMGQIKPLKRKNEFFILDYRSFKKVLTSKKQASKRAVIRGRVCATYSKKEICSMLEKITNTSCKDLEKNKEKNLKKYMNKTNLCLVFELILRHYNNTDKDKQKWFITILDEPSSN